MGRKLPLSIKSKEFALVSIANALVLISLEIDTLPASLIIAIANSLILWFIYRNKENIIQLPQANEFDALELAVQDQGLKKYYYSRTLLELTIIVIFMFIDIIQIRRFTGVDNRILPIIIAFAVNLVRIIKIVREDFQGKVVQLRKEVFNSRNVDMEKAKEFVQRECNTQEQMEILTLYLRTNMGANNPNLKWEDIKALVKSFPDKNIMKQALERGFTDYATYLHAKTAEAPTFEDYQKVQNTGFITLRQFKDAQERGFHTAKEFEDAQKRGCTTIDEYNSVIKGGFNSFEEYQVAKSFGFITKTTFDQAKEMGARTNQEYMMLLKLGIPDMKTYRKMLEKGFPVQHEGDYTEYLKLMSLGFETYDQFQEAKNAGCNDSKSFEKLKEGGFPDCQTMKQAMKKGFTDYTTYQDAQHKGFSNYKDYKEAHANGVTDGELWKTMTEKGFTDSVQYSNAISNGFSTQREYQKAMEMGFKTKAQYEKFLKSGYPDRKTWIDGVDKGFIEYKDYRNAQQMGAENFDQLEILQRDGQKKRSFIIHARNDLKAIEGMLKKLETIYQNFNSRNINYMDLENIIDQLLALQSEIGAISIRADYDYFPELKKSLMKVKNFKRELEQKLVESLSELKEEWKVIQPITVAKMNEPLNLNIMFQDVAFAKRTIQKYLNGYVKLKENTLVVIQWIPTWVHLKETKNNLNKIINELSQNKSISLYSLMEKAGFKGSYGQFLNHFEEHIEALQSLGTLDLEHGIFTKTDEISPISRKELIRKIKDKLDTLTTGQSITIRKLHESLNTNLPVEKITSIVEEEIRNYPRLDIVYPEGKIRFSSLPTCTICRREIEINQKISRHLKCGTRFHRSCIIVKVTTEKTCPQCKDSWILDEALHS